MVLFRAIIYRWCEQVAIHTDLNRNLRDITSYSSRSTVQNGTREAWFNYASCLLLCLEGLPLTKYDILYRGYNCGFMEIFNSSCYGDKCTEPEETVGKRILLSSFTSTSTNSSVVQFGAFAHGNSRTTFVIKNVEGYDIRHLAIDKKEFEILCPPGLVLEITRVSPDTPAPGNTTVHLTVVTPGITLK